MLATVMNALALEGALEEAKSPARVLSAVAMPSLCQPYSRQAALPILPRDALLSSPAGPAIRSSPPTPARRSARPNSPAIAVMKATQVDGVYSADPKRDPNATRYDRLTHDEAIARNWQVMDTAAFALARDNGIPIVVFSIREEGAIRAALEGKGRATCVWPS